MFCKISHYLICQFVIHTEAKRLTDLTKQTKAQQLFCSLTAPSQEKKSNFLNKDVCHITSMAFCIWGLQIYLKFMHGKSARILKN